MIFNSVCICGPFDELVDLCYSRWQTGSRLGRLIIGPPRTLLETRHRCSGAATPAPVPGLQVSDVRRSRRSGPPCVFSVKPHATRLFAFRCPRPRPHVVNKASRVSCFTQITLLEPISSKRSICPRVQRANNFLKLSVRWLAPSSLLKFACSKFGSGYHAWALISTATPCPGRGLRDNVRSLSSILRDRLPTKVERTQFPIDESTVELFQSYYFQRNLRNNGWFGAQGRQRRHKWSFSHAIQKQHSRCRVSGCNHDHGIGRRRGRGRWRRRGRWRGRGQQFRGHEWNRSGRPGCPGRNESRLRRQSANDARFSGQSSTRLHRRIERNDERERAKQHSNSDGIEHDKFLGRHGVLTTLRSFIGGSGVGSTLPPVSTAQTPENI
jgi:hypothetical protein